MALRVLLADNSETIKKVIQLTLQDFAIDLRIVTLGVDVIDVAQKFKPDIVFVDILLQKKSGYDVSKEIKLHPQLKATPVVLMWSGFMEFDEKKAQECLADARLEKPFDAQTLRGLVNTLVKKTTTQNIAQFLDFPPLPPQELTPKKSSDPLKDLEKIKKESEKFAQPLKQPATPQKPKAMAPLQPASTNYELPDIPLGDDPSEEDFEMQNLSPNPSGAKPAAAASNPVSNAFSIDDNLTKSYVLNIPDDSSPDDIPGDFDKMESIQDMSFLLSPEEAKKVKTENASESAAPKKEEATRIIDHAASKTEVTKTELQTKVQAAPNIQVPPVAEIEQMVRELLKTQAQETLEKVVWQVVPELASQIIKTELERLLRESNPKA